MAETLQCVVGRPFTIALEVNATAGFEWQPELDAEAVRLVGREYENRPPGVGGAVTERFTFLALKPGAAQIRFDLRRPWEAEARETRSFAIQADTQ